tara:strand:- start:181 stop:498 length:318 start_codon:yes stop_codon:yes gene_type:complete
MKYIKIYFLIQIIFLFTSCSTLKDGFKNQKKGNSDEFLVEKKSPLIMPPDYGELPIPKPENDQKNTNSEGKIIKSLITNKDDNSVLENSSNDKFEETILKKIKKN